METVYETSARDREQLREPRGAVVQGETLREHVDEADYHRLIAVGDRVSLDLADWGLDPDIAVVDCRIQRKEIPESELDRLEADHAEQVYNPAGSITRDAWDAVRECVARQCSSRLRVNGEEDLLALPAITYASPDSLIVYGQRDEGAVVLRPDADLKVFVDELTGYRTYDHVIVGGSWDRLHCGHRSLLLEAFARGEHIDIGITSDAYMHEKDVDGFQSFDERQEQLDAVLRRFGLEERAQLMEIEDYRGNAVEQGDALVVTEETMEGAREINQERQESGKDALDIVQVPLVADEAGTPVSSSRIREETVDRDGVRIS